MDIYASDEEKGEEIKQWWRDNGSSVIFGCILGVAILVGGRYWLNYQQTQTESASLAYQQVVALLAEDNVTEADDKTQQLLSTFANTPYAAFAAFEMAKQSVDNNDLVATKSYLEWVMVNGKLTGQVEIARLRIARLLLDESDYQQALSLIEQSNSTAFTSLFAELRGDIFAAQGQDKQAREAYQEALLTLSQGEPRQQLLNLKLDDTADSNDG